MAVRVRRTADKHFTVRQPTGGTLSDRVINFIEQLPIIRGDYRAKTTVKLFPFQKQIIRGMHKKSIKHSIISIPRKLGKSSLAAFLAITRLIMVERQKEGAQIVLVSVTARQATLLYDTIVDILDLLNPEGLDKINIRTDKGYVNIPEKGIRLRVIAEDSSGASSMGYDTNFSIIDEPGGMVSPMCYQSLKTGSPNGELLLIGTQSHLVDASEHWYTKLLHEPDLPKHHYRYFLGATDKELKNDWRKPALWKRLTPATQIKSLRYISNEYQDAVKFGTERSFKIFHLNGMMPETSEETSICSASELRACYDKSASITRGSEIVIGLDLSQIADCSVVCCLDYKTGYTLSHFWIPLKAKKQTPNINYDLYQKKKYCTVTEAPCVDFEDIAKFILKLQKKYKIIAICRDNWLSHQWQLTADRMGILAPAHSVIQIGAQMGKATKMLQRYIKEGKLKINNPLLRLHLEATRWSQDTNLNLRPHKQLSMSRAKGHRIDGTLALANAMWYISEHNLTSSKDFFLTFLE